MSDAARQLLEAALALPEAEREALALTLLDSTGREAPEAIEEAWRTEIRQRIEALDRGELETVPWTEARRRIFARPR